MPGVIDSTSNFVEHPEVVADRLKQFSTFVPKEQIMAGTDCGFSTFAGFGKVDEKICILQTVFDCFRCLGGYANLKCR